MISVSRRSIAGLSVTVPTTLHLLYKHRVTRSRSHATGVLMPLHWIRQDFTVRAETVQRSLISRVDCRHPSAPLCRTCS